MGMSADTSQVTTAELRKFGLLFGFVIIVLFGLLLPWLFERPILMTGKAFIVGAVFIVWALVHAPGLKPAFVLWMKFGAIAGYINTHIIMVLLFGLLITPIGLLMRLVGYDPMRRSLNDASFRVVRDKQRPNSDMEKPF